MIDAFVYIRSVPDSVVIEPLLEFIWEAFRVETFAVPNDIWSIFKSLTFSVETFAVVNVPFVYVRFVPSIFVIEAFVAFISFAVIDKNVKLSTVKFTELRP